MFIRVNVDDEINNTAIKERNEIIISMIYDVFAERKVKLRESDIDICYDFWVFIIINWMSWGYDP